MKKVIRVNTTLTAAICGYKTEIKLYDRAAEFSIGDKHFVAYNANDDMVFVVLLGIGADKNNDATWENYCDAAGWWRSCHTFAEAKTDIGAAEDLCDAIENCVKRVMSAYKIETVLKAL